MASITQHIPNYVLGMSEQPDELKTPGQVVDLNNALPDVTLGCTKRPGTDLVKVITPAASGKWFDIYRADDESYLGQVATDGSVKVWRTSDGVEIPVDYGNVAGSGVATYLAHTNSEEIQPFGLNETVLFCNREKVVAMKTTSLTKTKVAVNEAFISLRTIAYGKQYALDIFDPTNHSTVTYNRATSIEADDTVSFSFGNDGHCTGQGRYVVPPVETNSGTSYMNGGTGKSNLRYEMDARCTPVSQQTSNDDGILYDDSYQPYATLQFGGEGWSTNDTDSYVSEKGLTTTVKIKSHVAITSRANVALVRPEATSSNADENVSSESILSGIKTAIDSISGTGLTVTVTANGVHLHRDTPFLVTAPEEPLMDIITGSANDPSDLPKACRHGYVVKVVNSGNDQDDYYLKFKVDNIDVDNEVTASYARSGTTITVTSTSHGLAVGDTLIADFTAGAATDGWYSVASVADANTFTVTDSASGTIGTQTNGVTYTPNRFGTGVWEECAAPNLEIEFDDDTMPLRLNRGDPSTEYTIATSAVNTSAETITITGHGRSTGDELLYLHGGGTALAGLTTATKYYAIVTDANTIKLATSASNATAGTAINLTGTGNNAQTLVYASYSINGGASAHYSNGIFRFEYPDWDKRDVGDDITNPKPSFVGQKISKIFFYRSRIGLLSEENVILSRTNDYFNFWAKTAFTIAATDPIDLQSSSTYPTKLFDAIEVNAGLLVLSASQQFLLTTDETTLTPETVRISFLSSYGFNEKTVPFSLGVTVGFLNSTAKRTRFYEMINIQRNGEPDVAEQTKVVSKIFPTDITLPTSSTENDLILFASENKNEVWGYRFFNQGNQRVQNAWFRWTLPGTVTYHTIMDDVYYTVLKNGGVYTLEAADIKKADDTSVVGTAPDDYKVHLDTKSIIASASLGYSTSTNRSGFTKPDGYNSSQQLVVYCHSSGDNAGRYSTASVVGSNIEFDGDWTGQDIIVGYLYEMEVELPKIYVQQVEGKSVRSDTHASLVLHRLNFSFGSVGVIDTTLKRKGRPDYSKTYESLEWDTFSLNTVGIADDYIHTIPVYEKNTNLNVHLKSSHPSPATLYSMTWEGDYNPKFYRRV